MTTISWVTSERRQTDDKNQMIASTLLRVTDDEVDNRMRMTDDEVDDDDDVADSTSLTVNWCSVGMRDWHGDMPFPDSLRTPSYSKDKTGWLSSSRMYTVTFCMASVAASGSSVDAGRAPYEPPQQRYDGMMKCLLPRDQSADRWRLRYHKMMISAP